MRLLCFLAALAFCTAATAQPLTVRSGDHASFSRLTIPLPATQNWEARQTESGVIITLPGHTGGFDIADVFVRMRRDRIEALEGNQNSLTLRVACPCASTAFISGTLLVIDVADQGTKMSAAPLEKSTATWDARRPPNTDRTLVARSTLPWIGSVSPFGEATEGADVPSNARSIKEPMGLIADRATLLREIRQDLLTEVAVAASTGLLSNSYEAPSPVQISDIVNKAGAPIETQSFPMNTGDNSNNIRITSSMDLPEGTFHSELDATTSGAICPDTALVDVGAWGSDQGFSAQIGSARNNLMNARDHLDISAAKTLAKLYIFFGFGAEALEVLHLDPALASRHPQLVDIATIFEHGAIARRNSLAPYTDCTTDIALWAILSFRTVPSGTLIDTKAALRALNRVPTHLRLILAPALSDRLLQYGDHESASAALRTIERLPDDLSPNAQMAQADLAVGAGQSADALLEGVIGSNSSESPAALVKLVQVKLEKGEALTDETATLVEAYAQELRGTELGNQLRRTQVLALSQSEQFDEAFEALDAIAPSLSPQTSLQLRQAVFEGLAKQASDLTFLTQIFAQDSTAIKTLPTQTRLLLAARLMDLGFAAEVQLVLETVPDAPRLNNRQLLAARAAISLQQPFQAQAALIGIEGSDAALLLAQAKEMSGAYREASTIFRTNNAAAEAIRAAWLSDQWRDLTTPDTPGFGVIAGLATSPVVTAEADAGPLERANQALDESSDARATLENLLRDPMVQVKPAS